MPSENYVSEVPCPRKQLSRHARTGMKVGKMSEKNNIDSLKKKVDEEIQSNDKIIGCLASRRFNRDSVLEDTSEENEFGISAAVDHRRAGITALSNPPELNNVQFKRRRLAMFNETGEMEDGDFEVRN